MSQSAKSAFLKIVIILNRYTTLPIPPLHISPQNISTSEGEISSSKISSEGGDIVDNTPVDDIMKRIMKPYTPLTSPLYSG